MSERKFTDGNWKVRIDETFPTLHQIWNDVSSDDIPTFIARTCYAPRSEANAKLMAAAPELLEIALRLKKSLDDNRSKNYMIELLAREFVDLDKTIKKALS
jgi:hypothetical protein